jgi:hypothetical protein
LIFSCYDLHIALTKLPNIDVNLPFSSCTKIALLRTKVALSHIKVASQQISSEHMEMRPSFEDLVVRIPKVKADHNFEIRPKNYSFLNLF